MTTIDPSLDQPADACATDRSCADSGCGCGTPNEPDQGPATSRRGLKAGMLAAACAAACLAGPLAVGAAVAMSGAIAVGWWLAIGLAVAAVMIAVVMARRNRTGKLC